MYNEYFKNNKNEDKPISIYNRRAQEKISKKDEKILTYVYKIINYARMKEGLEPINQNKKKKYSQTNHNDK